MRESLLKGFPFTIENTLFIITIFKRYSLTFVSYLYTYSLTNPNNKLTTNNYFDSPVSLIFYILTNIL
jgi:hypothetical protein